MLAYLLIYMVAAGQLILLSSELCSIVGVPEGGSQALVTVLGCHYTACPPGLPQQDLTEEFTRF